MAESAQDRAGGAKRTSPTVYVQLALGMAVFGSATPISKIVTGAMPVFVGSAFRVGLGALVLAPFVVRRRDEVRRLGRRDWLLVALVSLFGMFGFSALMLYGTGMISGVVGAVVMSTAPAVTAAASMLLLGDQPTWRKLVAIALAVVGVLILNLGQGGPEEGSRSMLLGVALVFGAVCCEAAYNLLGKKATERVDPILVAGLSAALSLPVFLPLAVWSGATSRSPRPAGARGRRSPGTGPAPWRSAAGSGTRAWPGRRAPSPPASWA